MRRHIRIESDEMVVTNARIIYVDGEDETDISSCVASADVHIGIGDPPMATLRVYVGSASVTTSQPASSRTRTEHMAVKS